MKKLVRTFLTGVVVVAPFAVTAYLIWWAGTALDRLARGAIAVLAPGAGRFLFPGAGALVLVVSVYLVGLLMRVWVFRWTVRLLERLFHHLPVVKGLYDSIRDVLRLFGGDAAQMGQVVRYRLPGTQVELLGIRTSTQPRGASGSGKVAVFLPMSYQFGGFTLYVPAETVSPIDMTVEEALKIAATADAGPAPEPAPQDQPAPQ
ncbi:MAG: hypothetical protein B1H04_02185 [Planctomycetales bacterium 4484_123]|nr:MAG: hypothetical protein B1H04_02185 [Planctomycetales bacterium 4484_123]